MLTFRRVLFAFCAMLPASAFGGSFTTLHAFAGGVADGTGPNSLLLHGPTLYGTTEAGGSSACAVQNVTGCGILFRVDVASGAETTVLAFDPGAQFPDTLAYGGGRVFVEATYGGQTGTLVSVSPRNPKETVVYGFAGAQGGFGQGPFGPFVYTGGVLTGTTTWGGKFGTCPSNGYGGCGTIFQVDVKTGQQTLQYSFNTPVNGENPEGLVRGPGSLFYGVTFWGGTATGCAVNGNLGCGLVFAFDSSTAKETVLYRFKGGTDDGNPGALLFADKRLYGIAASTLFALDPATGTFTTLHTFQGGADGQGPTTIVAAGNTLYGTTAGGGANGNGTIWSYDIGTAKEQVLYSFADPATDGQQPNALVYGNGVLYGTTRFGGANFGGTVYKFVP